MCPLFALRGLRLSLPALAAALALNAPAHAESARFSVTDQAVSPAALPVTATLEFPGEGASFFNGGGFEPITYRFWATATADSPQDRPGPISLALSDLSHWNSLRDGALDGASIEVLRIENGQFRQVRTGVIGEGGYALSGWWDASGPGVSLARDLRSATMAVDDWERPGRPRWLTVRLYDSQGRLSDYADPLRVDLPGDLKPSAEPVPDPETTDQPDVPKDPMAPPDPHGPLPPEGLTGGWRDDARIALSWDLPPDDDDIAGALVYLSYVDPAEMRGFGLETEDAANGERVRAGDLVILRKQFDHRDRRDIASDRIWNAHELSRWLKLPMPGFPDQAGDAQWTLRPHDPDPQRVWGGRSYLHVDLPGRSRFAITQYNHAGTSQSYYQVLEPGVEYTVSARLRGQRAGRAQFRFGGPYRDLPSVGLDYGTEWAEVSASFTVPEVLTETTPVGEMIFSVQGPGWVNIDDLRVHRADTPYLSLSKEDQTALRDARISALRMHATSRTGRVTYDLPAVLDSDGFTASHPQAPGIPGTMEWSRDVGADPWFQIEPHFTPDEWLGLIEYLAAPFDAARDDPAERPWAALRHAQGQAAPWADQFGRIYLELGNETWNRLFHPWNFPPMTDGATGEKYGDAEVYGIYQAYVAGILRSSPWWDAAGLEDKVVFVIGGWAGFDYGERAAAKALPHDAADLLSIAAYNGGWDEDEGPVSRDRASYQNLLGQTVQVTAVRTRDLNDAADALAALTGRRPAIGTYEAGPGYVLDGLNNARLSREQADQQEQVMKGRAAGVSTLDTFLMQRQLGMTVQNFFTFGRGQYWKSHLPWYHGGAAYPSWELLAVMNREGGGEMLDVQVLATPRRDLAGFQRRPAISGAPEIAVYAARQDDRLTVFAISRQVPDGSGEGACTPVEIALPVSAAESVRLIRTGGAYDDNPITGPAPVIEELTLSPSLIGGGTMTIAGPDSGAPDCGLPGASAYIYVLEGVSS